MDWASRLLEGFLDIQTFIGVGVSVFFFLIGYRQTIGARKERAHAANTDLERTLLKRVVLEGYTPSIEELSRLIEGKARDHRVKISDVLSQSQLLNTVFTRIIETDFITGEQRTHVLGRLSPLLHRAEEAPVDEMRVIELTADQASSIKSLIPIFMGILSAVAGTLIPFAYSAQTAGRIPIREIAIVFFSSLILVGTVMLFLKLRDVQEESSSGTSVRFSRYFQNRVARILAQAGAIVRLAGSNTGADFLANLGGKQLLVKVKAVGNEMPVALLKNTVEQLRQAIDEHKADQAIIVTRSPIRPLDLGLDHAKMRLLSIKELRAYLASLKE